VGHQIIKEPGKDTYAVFSSFTDTWILWNATREELIGFYVQRATDRERRLTAATLDLVDEDPRKAYFQFAMEFEEANQASIEHGGPDLAKPDGQEEHDG
jgi:hypothetical protein